MKSKNIFYTFIEKASTKAGVMMIVDKTKTVLRIGDKERWRNTPEFDLLNGEYSNYHSGSNGVILVSEKFKNILSSFLPDDYPLEFLPAQVRSGVYGNRVYYIIYYKSVFGVVDKTHSKYADDAITVTAFSYEVVKDLPVFPDEGLGDNLCFSMVVNREVYKALKKNEMLVGLDVLKRYAY